jgi:hypothetical protein
MSPIKFLCVFDRSSSHHVATLEHILYCSLILRNTIRIGRMKIGYAAMRGGTCVEKLGVRRILIQYTDTDPKQRLLLDINATF